MEGIPNADSGGGCVLLPIRSVANLPYTMLQECVLAWHEQLHTRVFRVDEGVDPELWNLELPSILGIAWRGEYSGDEGDARSDACGSSVMSYSADGSGVEHSPDMRDIMEYDLRKASAEGVIYGQGHAPSMQRWSLPDKDHVYRRLDLCQQHARPCILRSS